MPDEKVIVSPAIIPVRLAALEVAKSKLGEREDRDHLTGHGLNTGAIVDWACEGLTGRRGLPWCAYFYCQCVRRVLLDRGEVQLLAQWMHLASGDCDELWKRLSAEGWAWTWGANGRVPEPGDALFYATLDKYGQPRFHRDGTPDLRHVAFVEEFAPPHVHDLSGNHGDQVARHKASVSDKSLYGAARIPW